MKFIVSFTAFLLFNGLIKAQNASVQLVHAIADTSLHTIDIWLSNTKIADNISFRESTGIISFPAVIATELRISDSSSTDTLNPIFIYRDSLTVGEKYLMIASGILDSTAAYSHFKPLNFYRTPEAREFSLFSGYSDVIFYHAVTDLERISISETRELNTELESDLGYSEFSGYSEIETSNYRFRLKELNNQFAAGEFDAFLASNNLEDSSLIVLVSGFQNPDSNSNGPSLGVDVITSQGNAYSLPISNGKIQFLHNSADPELAKIDLYVNDVLGINSFDFQSASGSLTFPSGIELVIKLSSDSANGPNESFFSKSINVTANQESIAIISGLNGSNFDPIEPLDIYMNEAQTSASIGSNTDIIFFNASTDFGSAGLKETSILNSDLFSDVNYGEFSSYISLPTANYKVDLFSNGEKFSSSGLNLDNYSLSGAAITLMTSGFVDTAANSNGEEFGLWFARSSAGKFTKLSSPLSIESIHQNKLHIFPNPSSSIINIESSENIEEVNIFNSLGQSVMNETDCKSPKQIDVSNFPRGVYILTTTFNSTVQSERLIIE